MRLSIFERLDSRAFIAGLAVLILLAASPGPVRAAPSQSKMLKPDSCSSVHNQPSLSETAKAATKALPTLSAAKRILAGIDEKHPSPPAVYTVRLLEKLVSSHATLANLSLAPASERPVTLLQLVANGLQYESLTILHQHIFSFLTELESRIASSRSGELDSPFVLKSLSSQLSRVIARANDVRARVQKLASSEVSSLDGLEIFGFMDMAQAEKNYFNGGDPFDANTVVGRFLRESLAKDSGSVKVVNHRFQTKPRASERGVEKTVVILDQRLSNSFSKSLLEAGNYSSHYYEPDQGTLTWIHNGEQNSYARREDYDGRNFPWNSRVRTEDEIEFNDGETFPIVNMATVEASHFENYFRLGQLTDRKRSKYPSSLRGDGGLPYVDSGAYVCCTHWIGEAPFGYYRKEKGKWSTARTTEYRFPGNVDEYGDAPSLLNPDASSPSARVSTLRAYNRFVSPHGPSAAVGSTSRIDRLTRLVWQYPSAPLQLWEVLGLRDQLDKAELTNPGWVRFAMVSRSTNDRIPVVFVISDAAPGRLSDAQARRWLDQLRREVSVY